MSVLRKYTLKRNEGLEKGTIHLIIGIYEFFLICYLNIYFLKLFSPPQRQMYHHQRKTILTFMLKQRHIVSIYVPG